MKFYLFALKRMNRHNLILWIITFFTAIISNFVIIATPIIQKHLINSITLVTPDNKNVVLLCVISLTGIITVILEGVILNHLFISLQRSIQRELLESALRTKNKIIESKGAGAYMVSVFGDSEHISMLMNTNIFSIVIQCFMAVIVLIITMSWNDLFVKIVIPAYILMIFIHILSDKLYIKYYQNGRNMVYEVNPKVLEYIENRDTILGYADIIQYETDMYELFNKRDLYFKTACGINSVASSMISAIKTGSLVLFFIFALFEIQKNALDISTFIAMVSYFGIIFQPISSIKMLNSGLHKFDTIRDKISGSLQEDIRYNIPENTNIEFKNCSFVYEDKEQITIHDFSLCLSQKTGLVGLSGEGKSTIIKMLLGDLKPVSGVCIYGNSDITSISRYIVRSDIRYYSQDIEIFNTTLQFNITLGKKGVDRNRYNECTDRLKNELFALQNEIRKGADVYRKKQYSDILKELFMLNASQLKRKDVCANILTTFSEMNEKMLEHISSMLISRKYYILDKYDALVKELGLEKLDGRIFGQRGCKISGGEKNKISLARFLLPEHGSYFILDEPFTNLDLVAEKHCLKILSDYTSHMKGIIISHKINIIRDFADKIVVLENGVITETGTHAELISNDGLYNVLNNEYEKGKLNSEANPFNQQ